MKVKQQRNLFIDSASTTQVNHKAQINLPSSSFNCKENELMRLTLSSFEMRRNFKTINDYNSVFFAVSNSALGVSVKIPNGDYHTFDQLALAIQSGLRGATAFGGTPTCVYDENARQFTFDMSTSASNWDSTNGYFTVYQDKNFNDGKASLYFQDTADILGGIPESDATNTTTPQNLFPKYTGDDHVSEYPPQLDTIGDIFLTTNLQTDNFSTHGWERNSSGTNTMTSTELFARIPVHRDLMLSGSNYVPVVSDIIRYEDSNNLYSVYVHNKQLTNIVFNLVDDKGREIPRATAGQFQSGNLKYKLTMKFEILDLELNQIGRPSGMIEGKYNSVITA